MKKPLTMTIDGAQKSISNINVRAYYEISGIDDVDKLTVEEKAEMIIAAFGWDVSPAELIEKADAVEFDVAAVAIPKMVLDTMSKASKILIDILGNDKAPKE